MNTVTFSGTDETPKTLEKNLIFTKFKHIESKAK